MPGPAAKPPDDIHYMRQALRLARRGLGRVEPNPAVGCVLVHGNRVIGEGYHRRFGGPHAEVDALHRATAPPAGATAYVTLEPCCHHGKTPPCVDALRAAAVARVVVGCLDPTPKNAGRGIKQLHAAGIKTTVGICHPEATRLIAPFQKLEHGNRPWVILKWAQSLDGKIATRLGDSKWITSEKMRTHAHRIRGRMDAIMVGIQTVLRDDPLLTPRLARPRRTATRIVLDSHLRTPSSARLVQTADIAPTWIFTSHQAIREQRKRAERLQASGCRLIPVRRRRDRLDLGSVLDTLGEARMTNLLVEGGGQLLGHFLDENLADELHIYLAPLLIGGQTATGPLHGRGFARVTDAVRLSENAKVRRLAEGWLLTERLPANPA